MSTNPPSGWYTDPSGRHQLRYWDGAHWTEHAADGGLQVVDPLTAPTQQTTRREARRLERAAHAENVKQEQARALQERLAADQRAQAEAHAQQEAENRALREAREFEERARRLPAFFLPEYNGYPNTEVAGEFARIDAIHAALGTPPRLDQEVVNDALFAALIPEPTNVYDRNAVMVIVNGQHVGYLEKEVAATVQPILRRIVDAGYAPVVGARIWAVARRDHENVRKLRHHANVRVALNYAHLLLPANDPPFEDYSVLPWGGSLQVTGEERHQAVLSNYVSPEGDTLVLGTLAVIEPARANAKSLVEVRIDGERIGQLTPASSQHFLPTIWHLHAQGATTAAWLRVKGNAIAAQVTIHATRAHELPADWFERAHTVPRIHGTTSRLSADAGRTDDIEIRAAMREPMWE